MLVKTTCIKLLGTEQSSLQRRVDGRNEKNRLEGGEADSFSVGQKRVEEKKHRSEGEEVVRERGEEKRWSEEGRGNERSDQEQES